MRSGGTLKKAGQGRKISILLMDDSAAIRGYFRDLLRETEFALWEAPDCGQAARYLAARDLAVDILLAEAMVDGRPCGWELALQMPSLRPGSKVILMSTRYLDALQAHDTYVKRGLYLWGVEFLPKPFTRGSLLNRLREVWAHGATPRLESASGVGRLGLDGFEATGC
jgi:DNA-binding response OmpR family regulator